MNACDRVGAFRGASTKGELQSSEGAPLQDIPSGLDLTLSVQYLIHPGDLLRAVLLVSLFQLSNLSRDTHLSKWKSREPGSTDVMKYF